MDVGRLFDGEHEIETGSNILLLAPPEELDAGSCIEQLYRVSSRSTAPSVVIVSDEHPATEIVAEWQRHGWELPSNFAIVSPTASVRTAAKAGERREIADVDGARLRTVAPADLTAVGTAVDDYLREWSDASRPVLWFDSVSSVVDATDLTTAFRFFHLLAGRIRDSGGTAYYRLDPTALESRAVATLSPLFDVVGR